MAKLPACDGRDYVFAARLARDKVAAAAESTAASTPVTSTPGNKDIITPPISVNRLDADIEATSTSNASGFDKVSNKSELTVTCSTQTDKYIE